MSGAVRARLAGGRCGSPPISTRSGMPSWMGLPHNVLQRPGASPERPLLHRRASGRLRGARQPVPLRRIRQRWLPVSSGNVLRTDYFKPQPPLVDGSARAFAGSWPDRRVPGTPPLLDRVQSRLHLGHFQQWLAWLNPPAGLPSTGGGRAGLLVSGPILLVVSDEAATVRATRSNPRHRLHTYACL